MAIVGNIFTVLFHQSVSLPHFNEIIITGKIILLSLLTYYYLACIIPELNER